MMTMRMVEHKGVKDCSTRENLALHCLAMENEVLSCGTGYSMVEICDILMMLGGFIFETEPSDRLYMYSRYSTYTNLAHSSTSVSDKSEAL